MTDTMKDIHTRSMYDMDKQWERFVKAIGKQVTPDELKLMHSAFMYAFGSGMQFAIEDIHRRTTDGNLKGGDAQA